MAKLIGKRDLLRTLFRLSLAIILCGALTVAIRFEGQRLHAAVPVLLIVSGAYVAGRIMEVTWRKLGDISLALFPKADGVVREAGRE